MELDPPAAMEIPEEYSDGGELNTGLLIALGIAGLCLVAVCLIYLVYRLRRLKSAEDGPLWYRPGSAAGSCLCWPG